MTTKPPDDPAHATFDEVVEAYGALSDIEALRLRRSAESQLWGTEFADPHELINEAVARTLAGSRRWPKATQFMAFLTMTMKSIADASRESPGQSRVELLEATSEEAGGADAALWAGGHYQADAVELAVERETEEGLQALAAADAALIEAAFAADDEVGAIIEGEKEGMPAGEVRAMFGLTTTAYDTARRRLRRWLTKHLPARSRP